MEVLGNWKKEGEKKREETPALTKIGTWQEPKAKAPTEKKFYESPEIQNALATSGDLETATRISQGDLPYALRVTRGVEPEAASNVQKIAEQLRYPKDTVERNLKDAKDLARAKEITNYLTEKNDDGTDKYPYTLAWLSDPSKMKVAKDDVEALGELERQMSAYEQMDEGFVKKSYRAVAYGANHFNQSIAALPSLVYNAAAYPQNKAAEVFNKPEWRASVGDNFLSKYYKEQAEAVKPIELNEDSIQQIKEGSLDDAAFNIYLQALSNAPQLAALFLGLAGGVSEVGTLTGMGALEASAANVEGIERGKAPSKAIEAAILRGTAEGFFEKYTLGMLKSFGKETARKVGKETAKELFRRVGGNIAKNAGIEGQSELATSLAQDLSDYITGDTEALEGAAGRALNAFLVGGFTGASISTGAHTSIEVARSAQLQKEMAAYDRATEIASESKLKKRDPEAFEEFVEQKTQGENVYIPMEAVTTFYQEDPDSLKKFAEELGIEDQLVEAEATGKDLEIKKSKWLAKFAGTDIGNAVKQDMRLSIDGMTLNEQAQLRSDIQVSLNEMQAENSELLAEETMPPQLQAMREQLIAKKDKGGAGLKAADADAQLAVIFAGAKQLSKQRGETAEQWFNRVNPVLNIGGEVGQADFEQAAFHGTPHDFDQFKLNKIDTGQGQQAFGWGLYFAKSKQVADYYRRRLSRKDFSVEGLSAKDNDNIKEIISGTTYDKVQDYASGIISGKKLKEELAHTIKVLEGSKIRGDRMLDAAVGRVNAMLEEGRIDKKDHGRRVKELEDNYAEREARVEGNIKTLEKLISIKKPNVRSGQLFRVEIPSSADMLNYEGKQTPKVRKILESEGIISKEETNIDGFNVYQRVAEQEGSEEKASRKLLALGIPGLRFSSNTGDSNFVIFDDSQVEVTKKFFQEKSDPRGSVQFKDAETLINLFEKANYSTLLHETNHIFTNEMQKLIDEGIADEKMQKDFATLVEFADGKLDTKGHEKIARAFEAYLREGKAPSIKLANAFQRFRAWLTAIYKSLAGLDVEINPAVREVFDRVLASETEIEEAKRYYSAKKSLSELIPVTKAQKEKLDKAKAKADETSLDRQVKTHMKAYLDATGGRATIANQAKADIDNMPVYKAIEDASENGGFDSAEIEELAGPNALETLRSKGKDVVSKGDFVKVEGKTQKEVKKSYHKSVLKYGGINPKSFDKGQLKFLKENGAFGVLRKTGQGLDQVAEEMIANNELSVPENTNAADYLFELLIGKASVVEQQGTLEEQAYVFEGDKGVALSEMAFVYDFNNPEELLNEMLKAPAKKDAVKERTETLLAKKEHEIREGLQAEETIPGDEAYHNDDRLAYMIAKAEVMAAKLERQDRAFQRRLEAKVFKDAAAEAIGRKKVREATRYDLYSKAERKFSKQASEALEKGDLLAAHEATKKEILNHAMVTAAVKAREERAKIEARYKTKNLKAKLNTTEDSYREAALNFINAFGLNKSVSAKDQNAKPDIKALDENLAGLTPSWVANKEAPQSGDYRDLTMDQLRELDASVQSIVHFGKDELKFLENEQYKTLTAFKEASLERMNKLPDQKIRDEFSKKGSLLNKVDGLVAQTVMNEFLFERLDNFEYTRDGKFGPLRTAHNAGVKAETDFNDTRQEVFKVAEPHLKKLYEATKRIEAQYDGKTFAIEGLPVNEDMKSVGRFGWTAERLVAFMLNTGNNGNLTALIEGYGLTEEHIQVVAGHFTQSELDSIQGLWDAIDTMAAPLDQTHFAIYNRHIDKVEGDAINITSKDGEKVTLKGGYYPLQFDHMINDTAEAFKEKRDTKEDDIMKNRNNNVFRKTKPEDGMTYSRTGGLLPPQLSLDVFFSHVNDTARYVSYAEYLRDMNRLTTDKEFRATVRQKAGRESYKNMRDNISYLALPERTNRDSFWGRVIDDQRRLATVAILGANIAVGTKQRLSMFSAVRRIGAAAVIQGMHQMGVKNSVAGLNGSEQWNNLLKQSPYMRTRAGNINQAISDVVTRLSPRVKRFEIAGRDFTFKDVQDFMFEWIQMNDRAAVGPIWMGAFNKHLAENNKIQDMTDAQRNQDAIEKADELIRTTQPSSLPIDLNSLQKSEGALRLFTSFMTYTFKYGNLLNHNYRAWKQGAISNKEYMKHVVYDTFLPAWGNALITGLLVSGEVPEWWEAFTAPIEMSASWIPVLRDLAGVYKYRRGIGDSPAFEGFNRAAKAGKSAWLLTKGDKEWYKAFWDIGRAVEYQVGIPVLNVVKEIDRQYNNITGKKKKKK